MESTKKKLSELNAIISKLPMSVCCAFVVPEFGFNWKEVSQLIRRSRLPMQPSSVARVLWKHAAVNPRDDLDNILGQLRLYLAAIQPRTWHVLRLQEPTGEEPVRSMLQHRVLTTLKNSKFRTSPLVRAVMMDDLMIFSVQFISATKQGAVLYVATPPGLPVALVSFIAADKVLKACAEGFGYASYENLGLYGKDIPSLLRIADPAWGANADTLTNIPPYQPTPVILPNGIDYTNKTYDEQYIDTIIGPNPPLLTHLNVKTTGNFFDRTLLNKPITMKMSVRTDDLAKTLRGWASKGAIAPTSEFFHIFHKVKSNNIENVQEDSDSD